MTANGCKSGLIGVDKENAGMRVEIAMLTKAYLALILFAPKREE
jgi:hypothetical protein